MEPAANAPREFREMTRADVLMAIAEAEAATKAADPTWTGFRGKVSRKPNAGSVLAEHVAMFYDATWEQISSCESWIKPACGGGIYQVWVFAPGNTGRAWTFVADGIPGEPKKAINASVTRSAGWVGPQLQFSGEDNAVSLAVGQGPETGATPHNVAPNGALPDLFRDLDRRSREADEKERRAELADLRRQQDERERNANARIEKLVELVAQSLNRPPPPPPPPGPGAVEVVTAVIATVTPIVTELMKMRGAAEERAEAARREEAARRLEIDAKREAAVADQAKHYSSILEAQSAAAKSQAEVQSSTARTTMQLLADIMQMQLRPAESEGPDWGKIFENGLAGIGAWAQMQAQMKAAAQAQGGAPRPPSPVPTPALAQPPQPPQQPIDIPSAESLDKIEDRIRAKDDPAAVAAALLDTLATDPAAQAEIQALGGLGPTVQDRMGEKSDRPFLPLPENAEYLAKLFEELQKVAVARGVTLQ